jgi:hypothetical protein
MSPLRSARQQNPALQSAQSISGTKEVGSMVRKSLLVSAVLSVLSLMVAAQSDFAGKWTGETQGRQGPQPISLELKVDAGKLTGTMTQGAQPAAEITDGKIVDATTVSFKRTLQGRGGGSIEIEYTGKIKGNELTLTPNFGGRGGGRGPAEITLKRAS